jgi:hypothetical protein
MRPPRQNSKKYVKFSPEAFMDTIHEEPQDTDNKESNQNPQHIPQKEFEWLIDQEFDQYYYSTHQKYEVLKKIMFGVAASAGIIALIIFRTAIYQLLIKHPTISTITGATIAGVCLHRFFCTSRQTKKDAAQDEREGIEDPDENMENLRLPFFM